MFIQHLMIGVSHILSTCLLSCLFNIFVPIKGNRTEDDNPMVDLTRPNNLSRSGIFRRYSSVLGPSPQPWMKPSTTSSLLLIASISFSG
uniref:MSH7 n=1 Tax=Arundo donax TaxID=35708 RepID=A0A0A9ES03_ARUDO